MKNSYNVIIDTNVIVSSLLTSHKDSSTVKVMDLFYAEKIKMYYSDEILSEYIEVLNRAKFAFDKEQINYIIEYIKAIGIKIEPDKIDKFILDMKDIPFYELVMDTRSKNVKLITGNIKHFPMMSQIMTPAEFIDMYDKNIK